MIYGVAKNRTMVRSILPSTKRKSTRAEKQRVKQTARANVRRALRRVDAESALEDDFDLNDGRDVAIRTIVQNRREADKVNHFVKWAAEVTRGLSSPDARLAHMRRLVPKNTIGDHAISHLIFRKEFNVDRWPVYGIGLSATQEEVKAYRNARHVERVRLLVQIIETGWGHQMLNRCMAHHHRQAFWFDRVEIIKKGTASSETGVGRVPVGPARPRRVYGIGDIETFLRDVYQASSVAIRMKVGKCVVTRVIRPSRQYQNITSATFVAETASNLQSNPNYHPEWLASLDKFLRIWGQCRGDRVMMQRKYIEFLKNGLWS